MNLEEGTSNVEIDDIVADKIGESTPKLKLKTRDLAAVPFFKLNCMLCFNFANGVLLASYMLLVLPLESQRIDESRRSVVLGSLMFIAGLTQLINPFVGLLSDRCASTWGRRRPFIVGGGVVGMLGIMLQDVASMNQLPILYYFAYTLSMLALNTAYTAVVGIMPDLVPPEQTGVATGIAALHTVAGANIGFLVYYSVNGNTAAHLSAMYMAYVLITGCCITLTVVTCKETPLVLPALDLGGSDDETGDGKKQKVHRRPWLAIPLQVNDVLKAYYIDPRKHKDFTFVFWSRTLYYLGVSMQTFFKYYLQDIVGVEDAETAIVKTAVIGQLCAAATAIPSGLVSDHIGRMRKPFIYLACAVLGAGNIANCFVRSETQVFVICGILGAANGIYLTMDAALALDTLPAGDEAARYMGVWGIGCFLGSAVGPVLGGPVLSLFGHSTQNQDAYKYEGYAVLLAVAALCFLLSGVILKRVDAKTSCRESSATA